MVNYYAMQQQIEGTIDKILEKTDPKHLNASRPEISSRNGKTTIEFKIADFPKSEFLPLIDFLKKYYTSFAELEADGIWGYKLKANVRDQWYLTKKKDEKANNTLIRVAFETLDGLDRVNKITFEKDTSYQQEEVNGIIALWEKYAIKDTPKEAGDPKVNLKDLGAIVYTDNKECTWNSIAGYERLKREIQQTLVLPFLHPEIYKEVHELTRTKASTNIPRAALFEGPPGTGKTTIARVIANESGLPLIYVPVESIMSAWYGQSERRLGQIFDECNRLEKSILFLDEIDGLATSREGNMHEATRRVLSVLLRKMQGFAAAQNVLTIGATNTANDLDRALLSRFNRRFLFALPNQAERISILQYYAKQLDQEDLVLIAKEADGRSGRDIEDICGDAERNWASTLIEKQQEVTPPPASIYLESVRNKFGTTSEQEEQSP